jgi:Holliday junction resolvase
MSREKGKRGEREVAAIISDLLGVSASRRVRQREGDSDILGVPGWCIEVKRWGSLHACEVNRAWAQAVEQAQRDGGIPALFFRANYQPWRVMWPLSVLLTMQSADMWVEPQWAAQTTPEAWAAVARECWMHEHVQAEATHPPQPACGLLKVEEPA